MWAWVNGYFLEHGQLITSDYTTEENVFPPRIHYLQLAPQLGAKLHEPLPHPFLVELGEISSYIGNHICCEFMSVIALPCPEESNKTGSNCEGKTYN